MRVTFSGIVSFLLIGVVLACSVEKTNEASGNTISFSIDESLIDETFTDSMRRFSIRIPKGLSLVTSLGAITRGTGIPDSLLAIYMDSAQTASVTIRTLVMDSTQFTIVIHHPDSLLNAQKLWQPVSITPFSWNNLEIYQALLQNSDIVNFRLFFKTDDNLIETNFVIQRQAYPQYLKKIESSIGSLRKI